MRLENGARFEPGAAPGNVAISKRCYTRRSEANALARALAVEQWRALRRMAGGRLPRHRDTTRRQRLERLKRAEVRLGVSDAAPDVGSFPVKEEGVCRTLTKEINRMNEFGAIAFSSQTANTVSYFRTSFFTYNIVTDCSHANRLFGCWRFRSGHFSLGPFLSRRFHRFDLLGGPESVARGGRGRRAAVVSPDLPATLPASWACSAP